MPFLNDPHYFDPKYVDPVTLAARIKANQNLSRWGGLKQFLTFAGTAGTATPAILGGNNLTSSGSNPMEVPQVPLKDNSDIFGDIFKKLGININLGGNSNPQSSSSNDWLKYLLPILAGVAGGLENRSQKTTSSTSPVIDPKLQPLQSSVVDNYMKLLNEDPDLTGYAAGQTGDLNKLAALQKKNALETFAAHGVGGPAVATGINSIDNNRFSNLIKLKQGLPLLSRKLKEDTLTNAGSFFNASPKGSTTETNTSGNILGGALSGSTELLAYLYGLGKL